MQDINQRQVLTQIGTPNLNNDIFVAKRIVFESTPSECENLFFKEWQNALKISDPEEALKQLRMLVKNKNKRFRSIDDEWSPSKKD